MTTEATKPTADAAETGSPAATAQELDVEGFDASGRPEGATVSFRDVHRYFGATHALEGFSLDVAAGEFVALLGPSGCGKTTALRVLAGFERPDRGTVHVRGSDVTRLPSQRRDMGMVFQSYSLFPNMSARDNVAFGLRMRHQRSAQRRQRADELLSIVGLAEHRFKYPHQLSGGQQQRVALARALAIEPQVLLLDEPLSALDAKVRAELRDEIRAIQLRLAITTVFVTHDQEEALSMADRVCVMSAGRIEQAAAPDLLYSHPETPFVAQFVGVSSRVPAEHDGTYVEVLGRRVPRRGAAAPTGRVDALLRPEDVGVVADPAGDAIVVASSFLGGTTRLEVALPDARLKVDVPSRLAAVHPFGERVRLELHAADVLVVPAQT